jgi:hypothetical protein
LDGKLNEYLSGINEQAQELFSRLVRQLAEAKGISEALKETDHMPWVGDMNNIQARTREIVKSSTRKSAMLDDIIIIKECKTRGVPGFALLHSWIYIG